jgi:hypothetical protein
VKFLEIMTADGAVAINPAYILAIEAAYTGSGTKIHLIEDQMYRATADYGAVLEALAELVPEESATTD